jgi:phosphoglycolate phosphatase-like HAD superfamily hydrolase
MKLLLFDLDGTLVRADGAGRKALNRAIFNIYKIKQDGSKYNLAGKTDLRNFAEAIELTIGKRASRAAVDRVHKEYLKCLPHYMSVTLRSKKYRYPRGIRRLLKRLSKEKELILALGTGNMEKGARIKLEPSGFNKYFEFGGFGSDAYSRPVLLKTAFRRAKKRAEGKKLRAKDVYVIGDTPLDVSAGKAVGYKTVAVGTGYSDWKELKASNPDFISKDFRDVKQWLRWFGVKNGGKNGG